MAANSKLDFGNPSAGWADQGEIVRITNSNNYNAIDADVVQTANGEYWMTYGSWNAGGIRLIKLDPKTGKQASDDKTNYQIASRGGKYNHIHIRDVVFTDDNWPEMGLPFLSRYLTASGNSGEVLVGNIMFGNSTQAPATLTKHGAGSSSQTVEAGAEITSYYYDFANATGVEVMGLPTGLKADVDATAKKVTISGKVDAKISATITVTRANATTVSSSCEKTIVSSSSNTPVVSSSSKTLDSSSSEDVETAIAKVNLTKLGYSVMRNGNGYTIHFDKLGNYILYVMNSIGQVVAHKTVGGRLEVQIENLPRANYMFRVFKRWANYYQA